MKHRSSRGKVAAFGRIPVQVAQTASLRHKLNSSATSVSLTAEPKIIIQRLVKIIDYTPCPGMQRRNSGASLGLDRDDFRDGLPGFRQNDPRLRLVFAP